MKLNATSFPIAVLMLACSHDLPARYVIDHDLGGFVYRRYQKTLDVEFAVEGNQATGYTATYLRHGSGKTVAIATAFVTVYQRADSLTAEVRERLKALERYKLAVQEVGDGYAWTLDAGPSERWALWVSGSHLVKLGAPPGELIPDALAEAYMDMYPSDLDEHGYARSDAPSRGPSKAERKESGEQEREMPKSLREHAPR
jgi:hypothetical protein